MDDFIFEAFPARIVFCAGKIAEVPAELDRLDASSALLITTLSQSFVADEIERSLGTRCAARIDGAVMHVPREMPTQRLRLVKRKTAIV